VLGTFSPDDAMREASAPGMSPGRAAWALARIWKPKPEALENLKRYLFSEDPAVFIPAWQRMGYLPRALWDPALSISDPRRLYLALRLLEDRSGDTDLVPQLAEPLLRLASSSDPALLELMEEAAAKTRPSPSRRKTQRP